MNATVSARSRRVPGDTAKIRLLAQPSQICPFFCSHYVFDNLKASQAERPEDMLKALILTSAAALASVRLPPFAAAICLTALSFFEVVYLTHHQTHSIGHYAADFGGLQVIGQALYLLGNLLVP